MSLLLAWCAAAAQEQDLIDRVQTVPGAFAIRARTVVTPDEEPKVEGRRGEEWIPLEIVALGGKGLVALRPAGEIPAVRITTRAGRSAPAAAPPLVDRALPVTIRQTPLSATVTIVEVEPKERDAPWPLTVIVLDPHGSIGEGEVIQDALPGRSLRIVSPDRKDVRLAVVGADGSSTSALIRIGESESPRPRDRVSFSFSFFGGAGGAGGKEIGSSVAHAGRLQIQAGLGSWYLYLEDTVVPTELEFEVFDNTPPRPGFVEDDQAITVHSLTMGLGYEFQLSKEFDLYGQAGAGRYFVSGADGVRGHVTGSAGAGVRWWLSDHVALSAGASFTFGSASVHACLAEGVLREVWAVTVGAEIRW